jgi:hypothetical protein
MSKKYKHPEGKGTVEVRADQVEMYESQGWVEVKAPDKPAEDKPSK